MSIANYESYANLHAVDLLKGNIWQLADNRRCAAFLMDTHCWKLFRG